MKRGFTLIELLAVIVILAIIALIATPLILNVIEDARKGAFKSTAYGIVESAELSYVQDVLAGNNEEVTYTYTDGVESSSPSGKTLNYKGDKPQNGTVIINTEGKVALALHDGTYCAEKGYDEAEVTVSSKTVEDCTIGGTTPIVNADTSGASIPELTTGLIPVKWNGTNWIKADVNNEVGDNQWYDYDSKMWANAVTVTSTNRATYVSSSEGTVIDMADINTMWVWIPKYKYAIPTGTGAREINIVFEDKDETSSGDAIGTNYKTHPAFTFELQYLECG